MTNKKKALKDLNLEDDFLFAKVMSDMEICRKVLEKILNVPIRKVSVPTTQKSIDVLYDSKGIRLDVYINDDKGTVDPFKEKRHIYTFENRCRESLSLSLGDEAIKIFLNTKGKLDDVDDELKELLKYVENSTDEFAENSSSDLIKKIHKKVTDIKHNKKMEVEYMTLYMRDMENREEGRTEGRKEGRKEGRAEGIAEGKTAGVIDAVRQLGGTMETAIHQLMTLYGLNEADAKEKVNLYW